MKQVRVLIICLLLLSVAGGENIACKAGEGIVYAEVKKKGKCAKALDESRCSFAAYANSEHEFAGVKGGAFNGNMLASTAPSGCLTNGGGYSFNQNLDSVHSCGSDFKKRNCVCDSPSCVSCPAGRYGIGGRKAICKKCPVGKYSDGAKNSKCKNCPRGKFTSEVGQTSLKSCERCYGNHFCPGGTGQMLCTGGKEANDDHTACTDPKVAKQIQDIITELSKQKEKQNDLSIKNSRLWQKEQIRLQHDKLMQVRKARDNREEEDACSAELKDGTIIFPAIEVENEIEDVEDTTCIDTNRDELLKSFCGFRMDVDKLFKIQNIDKEAKSFWPNICCKERKDKTLEVCENPTGTIKRENIIPFALSQGGDYSRHNLYSEVKESIKEGGYIHTGMKTLIDSLPSIKNSKREEVKNLVESFFNDVSLCGPRIVDAPGNSERKLCELFVPYHHAMKSFYTLIESLFVKPIMPQSSFLETMERSLRKRSEATRLGKNNIQQMMQMKPKAAEATCIGGSKHTSKELEKYKRDFCLGYNHLDLSDTNIKNVAVHYLKNDISYDDKKMLELSKQLRYQVTDDSCPSPLFTAKDISIQQVAMDVLGNKKEWVAVVNLNTQDKNGYLQSELPYCKDRNYLIGAKVEVKTYLDETNCCDKLKSYEDCKAKVGCENNLKKLKDKNHKHYSKDVRVTGTQYSADDSHVSRRRRLLAGHRRRC